MSSPGDVNNSAGEQPTARSMVYENPAHQQLPESGFPKSAAALGWERISAAFRTATAPVEPGAQPPEAPPEVKEWAQNTLVGVMFGILYGGGRQWLKDRDAGQPRAPQGMPTKLHAANYVANIQTQRLLGKMRAAVRGGAVVGGLAGVFYGTQLLSSVARGRRDHRDIMAAGLTTGAVFGACMPGGPAVRLRSLFLGAGLGGLVGFPVGLVQEKLLDYMPEDPRYPRERQPPPVAAAETNSVDVSPPQLPYKTRRYDSTAAVIAQLEAGLQRDRANLARGQTDK